MHIDFIFNLYYNIFIRVYRLTSKLEQIYFKTCTKTCGFCRDAEGKPHIEYNRRKNEKKEIIWKKK